MNVGSVIKYYRSKNNMTQSQLADGICSISHLSKIESNTYTPHESTIEALLSKMGVQWKKEVVKRERLERQLNDFVICLLHYDLEQMEEQYSKLQEDDEYIQSTDLVNRYELYKFRYYLYIQDQNRSDRQKELLERLKNSFTESETWMHQLFLSLYFTQANKKELAMEYAKSLDGGMQSIPQKFEGEFYYQKARLLIMHEQYELSAHYAELSVQYFKLNYNYIRLLHAQLLLAINYMRRNLLVQAAGIFEVLKRNTRLMDQKELYNQTLYNFAELMKTRHEHSQAFDLLIELHEIMSKDTFFYKAVLVSLIETAVEIGADAWECVKELRELSAGPEDEYFLLYLNYFEKRNFSQPDLLTYSEEKMFPFFRKHGYIRESKKIALELAEHFQREQQWEKAMYYQSYYARNGG
ncbi:transcriptional regulator [Planococcus salinarum]|uniref:Transcriptional regulator n=1 Tax=Planococcus salinarum TaxID=622695 RepID=A0ABX3D0P7_9BACL|nr:helix-turn-helix transcriptional regulator [Planococcus salinarum]OHX52092.1 transcriptional regulator [Planococcus salinarum]TAA69716.1 XRE family transcriptional regulator [Planococcus salinarum]